MAVKLICLGIVFLAIILLLSLRRPLYQATAGGLALTALLYHIPPGRWLPLAAGVFTDWNSCQVLLSLYLITYLQRILEAKQQIKLAQQDLDGLFHNRKVNAAVAPLFIGLLPSAAAMLLCSSIVRDATDGYLDKKEQAFVTSWFRHIPESTLPTYSSVLLMTSLSGLPLPRFMAGMIPPIAVLILLGYLPFLRRLPADPGTPKSKNRRRDLLSLLGHLWTLLAILALILLGGLSVVPAVLVVILAAVLVYRLPPAQLWAMLKSAWETRMLLNTFLVLVLKEFLAYTEVLRLLPDALSLLPIPTYLIFALLFFFGGIISGTSGIIALGTPMAFAALPQGGIPLMILLMCVCHAASQISPTHVCLVVAAEDYQITLGALIRKALPFSLLFCLFAVFYYQFLALFF